MRATLTAFTAVVQSYVDQGVLPRNVAALVERPAAADVDEDDAEPDSETTAKSWTVAEAQRFRESVRDDRFYACWLLSCYGLRRSEVLGRRWSAIDGEVLRVRRGRVTVGTETIEGAPKSRRSRRELPMPAVLIEALRALKTRQKEAVLAIGVPWDEDRFVASREDGSPAAPDWYSDEFHRLRARAGLRRIKLHGLRNTSVTLMLDRGPGAHRGRMARPRSSGLAVDLLRRECR
ncbi:tyrosine-type recombinase/integrase [uncultured Gordonia sp.]|uniref:tyrosine-type recombinase/integrase n=1 Tax=uncultured Gordonia sp. TaxID=198437 RepID=UPI002590A7CF|nr:site-specific integrase [uncultured Gordonia sp.]